MASPLDLGLLLSNQTAGVDEAPGVLRWAKVLNTTPDKTLAVSLLKGYAGSVSWGSRWAWSAPPSPKALSIPSFFCAAKSVNIQAAVVEPNDPVFWDLPLAAMEEKE